MSGAGGVVLVEGREERHASYYAEVSSITNLWKIDWSRWRPHFFFSRFSAGGRAAKAFFDTSCTDVGRRFFAKGETAWHGIASEKPGMTTACN